MTATARKALERIRAICLALPETTERPSHGAPTFFAGAKTFVMFMDHHHDDGRLAIWCVAGLGVQDDLVRADPEQFFVPPYVGHRGWIGIRLDRAVDWVQTTSFIEDGYGIVAPRRALAKLGQRRSAR